MVATFSALLVVVGVLGIAVNQWQQQIAGTVVSAGARPVSSSAGPTSQARPEATTTAESGDAPAPPSAASTVLSVPVPRAVRMPTIDVSARVVPVGLRRDGALAIPDDVTLVGWYELGVPPGADRGSAVLVAHRDGRGQGKGVFYDLGRLDVDDRLTVRTATDESLDFRVVARESIRKQRLPYEELFSAEGTPRLTLISCGGAYDPDRGGYQDNVVVTAVPVRESWAPGGQP